MKKMIVLMALLLPLGACSQTERGAAIGGLGGAAIGAAVADNPGTGALVGGAIGATAGAIIGEASEDGMCRYRGRHGRVYVARCSDDYYYRRHHRHYRYD